MIRKALRIVLLAASSRASCSGGEGGHGSNGKDEGGKK